LSTTNKLKEITSAQNVGLSKSFAFTSPANAKHLHGHFLKYSKSKGMIFSLDAMISFVIILICALLFVFALNNYAQKAEQSVKDFELEEKALMIADSFVKNLDENNTIRGAGIYDSDKKRVRTNELTTENIKKAKSIEFGEIFVKSLTYTITEKSQTLQLSLKKSNECISAKRFVLIDGEKAIIQILTCREG